MMELKFLIYGHLGALGGTENTMFPEGTGGNGRNKSNGGTGDDRATASPGRTWGTKTGQQFYIMPVFIAAWTQTLQNHTERKWIM